MNWTKNPLIIFWLDKRNFGRAYPLGSVLSPPHLEKQSSITSAGSPTISPELIELLWTSDQVQRSGRASLFSARGVIYLHAVFTWTGYLKTTVQVKQIWEDPRWAWPHPECWGTYRVESTPWKQTPQPHRLMRWCLERWKKDLWEILLGIWKLKSDCNSQCFSGF